MENEKELLQLGLDAIYGPRDGKDSSTRSNNKLASMYVPVDVVESSTIQPRKNFKNHTLDELADSIKRNGVLQPILIRSKDKNKFEIIAGERRWRAAIIAGLKEIPAIQVKMDDELALVSALVENIQRENLNPIDEAVTYQNLIDRFHLTHEEIARRVGKNRSSISNYLRLLKLTTHVQELLIHNRIEVGHAKILVCLTHEEQNIIVSNIVEKELSVRQTEALIQSMKSSAPRAKKNKILHPQCDEWSELLTKKLSSNVSVNIDQSGEGRIVIKVSSIEEVNWLLEH